MAPITRSSMHGRPVSREGSWQASIDEDVQPQETADDQEVAGDADNVEDEATMEADQSDDGSGEDPFYEQQGMSARANTRISSLTTV